MNVHIVTLYNEMHNWTNDQIQPKSHHHYFLMQDRIFNTGVTWGTFNSDWARSRSNFSIEIGSFSQLVQSSKSWRRNYLGNCDRKCSVWQPYKTARKRHKNLCVVSTVLHKCWLLHINVIKGPVSHKIRRRSRREASAAKKIIPNHPNYTGSSHGAEALVK